MNEIIEKDLKIESMIYNIRSIDVMLDSDLAKLYECTNGTKDINKAVKRNIDKFPKDFMFQLTHDELQSLRFQIGTLNGNRGQHTKYLPYVFTEQGVAMLSSILHTDKAIGTSIKIMRAFVKMRHYIIDNKDLYKSLNNINNKMINYDTILLKHDEQFNYLFSKFEKKEKLFLKDETYDAYREILDIFSTAKKRNHCSRFLC